MPLEIIISITALQDILQGLFYYQQQQDGLGTKFEDRVNHTFTKIQQAPFNASFAYDYVRYKVVDKYPYIILYEFDEEAIYILRIFNTYLSPKRI